MVTLLHTADLHLGLSRYGTPAAPRVADFMATWDRFVDTAIERKVGAAVIAGDTFNTRFEGPEVRAAFVAGLVRLTRAGPKAIIVPGNHDGMTTIGDATSHSLRWLREAQLPGVYVFTLPDGGALIDLGRQGSVLVTALPYPHKRAFDTVLGDLHPEDRVLEAGKRLEAIITDLAAIRSEVAGAVRLFVGHLTVGGATVGSEATMRFTWDVAIQPGVLESFDYAALGHIHRQQRIGRSAWYAGSPEYIDFGEAGQVKGFLHVTAERDKDPIVEVVPSGARPMLDYVLREIAHDPEKGAAGATKWFWDGGPPGTIEPGSIVRLTLHPLTAAAGARVARKLQEYFAAASFLKVDQVRPTELRPTRVEVDADMGILEATERWLTAHDIKPDRYIAAARDIIAAQGG